MPEQPGSPSWHPAHGGLPAASAARLVKQPGLPPYLTFPSIEADGTASCACSTRLGGVSEAPYASMNLGTTTLDEPACVAENRRRFVAAVGHELSEWVRLEHGARVRVVDEAAVRQVAQAPEPPLPPADGVITRLRGVPLTIYTADCVPVVLVDPRSKALGVVHAGWRGTVAGAAPAAVEAMQREYGSSPASLLVGLGPSIGPCCFEVGDEVVEAVRAAWPQWQESILRRPIIEQASVPTETSKSGAHVSPGAVPAPRWHVDLWLLNRLQLMAAGVPESAIAESRLCTMCRPDLFFSYRRDLRVTGRLATTAVLH